MYEGTTDVKTLFAVFTVSLFFSLLATYSQWVLVDLTTLY